METPLTDAGALALLGLGFVFGLKHATEADHVVAVSAIVSRERRLLRSALVGGLWGVGHTVALVVVGAFVLVLRVAVPARVSGWLEFCVALMIVCLGASALVSALRRRADVHIHRHTHDGVSHVHVHFHERGTEHTSGGATEHTAQAAPHSHKLAEHSHEAAPHSHKGARRPQESGPHTHAVSRLGFKPLLVGALHGLAGSAALTLLVLTRIESAALGLVYLAVFGIGSVFGMMLMSGLIRLPFAFGARRASGVAHGLQAFAGAASVAFGLWYAYEAGVANSFWG